MEQFKFIIAEKLSKLANIEAAKLVDCFEVPRDKKKGDFAFPIPKLNKFIKISQNPAALAAQWAKEFEKDPMIEAVEAAGPYINFLVNKKTIVKDVLHQVCKEKEQYGTSKLGHGKVIIVEYSSPNIAKPFHAGHLRSTILGNFLKRIHETLGYKVVGINYLGDWGKQYGLLAAGYKRFGNPEALKNTPIKHLFEVYVKINKLGEEQPEIHDEARQIFRKMEDGDEESLALWREFREMSINEYKKIYARLGVEFDVYSGESLQTEGMKKALVELDEKKLLTKDEKGARLINLEEFKLGKALIQKTDGATLYLTRDIAAAIDRANTYHFEKMFYVVGAQQDHHFHQLFKILDLMGYPWVKECHHVHFGLVKGMSTRRGEVVFLEDILDEAKRSMMDVMKANDAKYAEIEDPERAADVLGLSAVFIQDLCAQSVKDYEFNWDRVLAFEGHTGPYLQFAYARLCGVERKCGIELNFNANLDLLTEKEVLDLVVQISRYPKVLVKAAEDLQPSVLVGYLFELSHAIGACHNILYVKGVEKELAEARLLLYWAARQTLASGMKILGLVPLERM